MVTGGYDKSVRLVDVRTGETVKTFLGHNSSVSKTIFNPHGNLIVSGYVSLRSGSEATLILVQVQG